MRALPISVIQAFPLVLRGSSRLRNSEASGVEINSETLSQQGENLLKQLHSNKLCYNGNTALCC
jgi:hypothetical protein